MIPIREEHAPDVRKCGTREQVVMPIDEFHALARRLRDSRAISID